MRQLFPGTDRSLFCLPDLNLSGFLVLLHLGCVISISKFNTIIHIEKSGRALLSGWADIYSWSSTPLLCLLWSSAHRSEPKLFPLLFRLRRNSGYSYLLLVLMPVLAKGKHSD